MTIIDEYLDNIAKAISGDSYSYPTHLLVTTDIALTNIDETQQSLSGEIGTRLITTNSNSGNVASYYALRSGTSVIGSTGDALTAIGFDIASTGSNLQLAALVTELQTTAFDLELQADVTISRG
jgi:hypothetical protein